MHCSLMLDGAFIETHKPTVPVMFFSRVFAKLPRAQPPPFLLTSTQIPITNLYPRKRKTKTCYASPLPRYTHAFSSSTSISAVW